MALAHDTSQELAGGVGSRIWVRMSGVWAAMEVVGSMSLRVCGEALSEVWPVLSSVAGALVLGCSLGILWRSPRWQGGGLSRRYEAPATSAASEDAWHSLDRGDDPTIDGQ